MWILLEHLQPQLKLKVQKQRRVIFPPERIYDHRSMIEAVFPPLSPLFDSICIIHSLYYLLFNIHIYMHDI